MSGGPSKRKSSSSQSKSRGSPHQDDMDVQLDQLLQSESGKQFRRFQNSSRFRQLQKDNTGFQKFLPKPVQMTPQQLRLFSEWKEQRQKRNRTSSTSTGGGGGGGHVSRGHSASSSGAGGHVSRGHSASSSGGGGHVSRGHSASASGGGGHVTRGHFMFPSGGGGGHVSKGHSMFPSGGGGGGGGHVSRGHSMFSSGGGGGGGGHVSRGHSMFPSGGGVVYHLNRRGRSSSSQDKNLGIYSGRLHQYDRVRIVNKLLPVLRKQYNLPDHIIETKLRDAMMMNTDEQGILRQARLSLSKSPKPKPKYGQLYTKAQLYDTDLHHYFDEEYPDTAYPNLHWETPDQRLRYFHELVKKKKKRKRDESGGGGGGGGKGKKKK